MHRLHYTKHLYKTPDRTLSLLAKMFPSVLFYVHLIGIVVRSSSVARRGKYGDDDWIDSSLDVLRRLELAGVKIDISGIENIESQDGPAVFIGNHMSMMETMLLPAIIQPIMPVTFVVKQSLLTYPVFRHIMLSRNPVAVTRTNPRQDFKVVMSEGVNRLRDGISVIVFPQTTRSHAFDPQHMSSIGVKLAKKAGVPVIPVALKTDCWQNGYWIKDFGRLDTSKTAYYSFGAPIKVEGKGDEEQIEVNAYITRALQKWGIPDMQ
jgi:1-acyl-sn-glycerol-3-phosphate acyltransferase